MLKRENYLLDIFFIRNCVKQFRIQAFLNAFQRICSIKFLLSFAPIDYCQIHVISLTKILSFCADEFNLSRWALAVSLSDPSVR